MMGIKDDYTAFCFDEAAAFILSRLKEGEEPVIKIGDSKSGGPAEYKRPSDLYNKYKH